LCEDELDKNPGPSRSLSSTNSFVRAKVVAFKSRTSSYYTLLAQYQQKYLIENVIRPRMNWSGDLLCSPSTTKSDMLKFILNDDINFMRLRYRIRVPAIETYLGTILLGNSIPNLQVQATKSLKDFESITAKGFHSKYSSLRHDYRLLYSSTPNQ